MELIYRKIEDLKKLENNPRTITEEQLSKLKESIERNPDYFEARPLILSNRTGELVIIAGNQRYDACVQLEMKEVPTVLIEGLTEEREHEIIIRDNVNNGEWDVTKLMEWDCNQLLDWGIADIDFNGFSSFLPDTLGAKDARVISLKDRFIIPPFSILDARQGRWQERKRAWR